MRLISRFSLLIILACIGTFAFGQDLKRPANYGFYPVPVDDATAKEKGMKETRGLLVQGVGPGTTFGEMGIVQGDVVLSVNGQRTDDRVALNAAKKNLWSGEKVKVEIWRDGKVSKVAGTMVGKPRETSDRWDVMYDKVPFDGGYLSGIVTKPKSKGPHPTIYFIPGYTCASVEALSPIHPYSKMLDSLNALGYVIFRVDKPGTGEGPNPCSCAETGFYKEVDVFRAGWKHLQQYDFVNKDEIYIFGHSMGGFEAPLLAAEEEINPRGVAVYGTAFQSWYEYIINMLRFQEPRNGEDYITFEQDMKEYTALFYEHYFLHKPLDKIITNPTWKALLERDFALDEAGNILWRKSFFWRELSEVNVTEAWAKTDAYVLSMYGEADFEVFNPFSMEEIARIVNTYHPGHGKYVFLDGTNHGMINVGSMEKEVALKGSPEYRDYVVNHFDWRLVTELHKWIQEVSEQP